MTAPAARRGRRPLIVLGLGLLGVAVVMLLLYGPFHGADYEAPGWYLHRFLASLMSSGARASDLGVLHRLASWVMYDFVPLLIVVLVLVMAVLPAAVALGRRSRHDDAAGGERQQDDPRADAARATRPGTTDSRTGRARDGGARGRRPRTGMRDRDRLGSLVFSDDGSIGAAGAAPGEGLELGIAELRGLADEAGLPWHSRYETEGGARGFLEILRALQDGPTGGGDRGGGCDGDGSDGDRGGGVRARRALRRGAFRSRDVRPCRRGGDGLLGSGSIRSRAVEPRRHRLGLHPHHPVQLRTGW